jgi:hypothetical protein
MERKETKPSIWFLISEKEFLTWLTSIGVDTSYVNRNRPYEFDRNIIKNEIFSHKLDLLINWISKNDDISELYMRNWNNGFNSNIYINIEKIHLDEIRVKRLLKEEEKVTIINQKVLDIKIVEEFLFNSFPKYFRDAKISRILKDELFIIK